MPFIFFTIFTNMLKYMWLTMKILCNKLMKHYIGYICIDFIHIQSLRDIKKCLQHKPYRLQKLCMYLNLYKENILKIFLRKIFCFCLIVHVLSFNRLSKKNYLCSLLYIENVHIETFYISLYNEDNHPIESNFLIPIVILIS